MGTIRHSNKDVSLLLPKTSIGCYLFVICILTSPCSPSALPGPPTRLTASEVTASSVKLSWDSGSREPVYSYIIQFKPKHDAAADYTEKRNIVHNVYTVTNLKAFTDYQFRVVAVSNIARSTPSAPLEVTTGELGLYFVFFNLKGLLVVFSSCAFFTPAPSVVS